MALRGALNPGFNLLYGLLLMLIIGMGVYSAYDLGVFRTHDLLVDCAAFLLGVLLGVPALFMNRKAISDLRDNLENKIFLSSQLALIDSRHGKNALVYFYFIIGLPFLGDTVIAGGPTAEVGFFCFGVYLSAHLLPFILPAKKLT